MSLLLALACWKIPEPADYSVVPFQNQHLKQSNAVVETVETDLECPDGSQARFYVVYDPEAEGPRPVAILLHSSAFDYVLDPEPADPLAGEHFAGIVDGVSRLEGTWGVRKVWETLGMHPQVDPAEVNTGAVAAMLAGSGVIAIYPSNCWGDLWHNETGVQPNNLAADYFDRDGGAFAWWMVRMLFDSAFASSKNITYGAQPDPDQLYLIGLGDGARGVVDLLNHENMPEVKGVLVDSMVDNLQDWANQVDGVEEGLQRIYFDPEGSGTVDYNLYSLKRSLNQGKLGDGRIAIVYSSVDPKVPAGNLSSLLAIAETLGDQACIVDTGETGHVFTNSDIVLARDILGFVLEANDPGYCQ